MGILLTTRLWPAAAVGAAALLALSACQTTGPKDSSGTNMALSEWKTIDASEMDLNLPLLIKQKVTRVEYQLRDNAVYHYRLQLEGGKGFVFTQYYWEAWYGDQSEKVLADRETFEKKVAGVLKGDLASIAEIRKIERKGGKRTVGFAAVADVKNPTKGKCFYSDAGYRVKAGTPYDNDFGNIDAVVEIVYCDPSVTIDDFSLALTDIEEVKDRAAYKAALASK